MMLYLLLGMVTGCSESHNPRLLTGTQLPSIEILSNKPYIYSFEYDGHRCVVAGAGSARSMECWPLPTPATVPDCPSWSSGC